MQTIWQKHPKRQVGFQTVGVWISPLPIDLWLRSPLMQDMNYHSARNNYLITTLRWINKPVLFLIVCWIWKKGIVACRSRFRLFGWPTDKNSVWAKYMGGPHGQKSVWATAHTAYTVPAHMLTVTHHGDSMRRGQRTFRPKNKEDQHPCIVPSNSLR